MATFIPMAVGAVVQGAAEQRAAQYNSDVLEAQARASNSEGYQREALERRAARDQIGRQAAAVAESGAGTGGSNALMLDQSAINAELDALNIRYGTRLKSTGLLMDAQQQREQGRAATLNGLMGAGGMLARGRAISIGQQATMRSVSGGTASGES